jgi:hypothetical protein
MCILKSEYVLMYFCSFMFFKIIFMLKHTNIMYANAFDVFINDCIISTNIGVVLILCEDVLV